MEVKRIDPESGLLRTFRDYDDRIRRVETRATGEVVVRDSVRTRDPITGVETIIGVLPDGTVGFQPFVGDTEPPPVPTAVNISAEPGVFVITWNGSFIGDEDQPKDFQHLNIIGRKVIDGVAQAPISLGVIRLSSESVLVSTDVCAVGETWRFTFQSEDYNKNLSAEGPPSPDTIMESTLADAAVADVIEQLQDAIDEKNSNYFQTTPPSGGIYIVGDQWFDTDDGNRLYLWDGATWVDFQDATIAELDAAVTEALTSANGKNTNYYQTTQPSGGTYIKGDLWFDTDDNFKLYTYTGSAWQPTQDAAGALSVATGKNQSFLAGTAPTAGAIGDLWIDTANSNQIKRWNGSTWVDARDTTIAAANTAAIAAQTTANGKNTSYYQTSQPSGGTYKTGDLWFDTDDNFKLYSYTGTTWQLVQDAKAASDLAAGKNQSFIAATAPTANAIGDMWIDTANGNQLKRWSGSTWVDARDTTIAAAQGTANTALTSANGKNKVYYQTSMPTGGTYILGDTWFDTDDGNKIYVYNGTTFVNAQDTTIATAQGTANTALTTANLKTKTYFQTSQPGTSGNTVGDMWFDTDDSNKVYVWNGSIWASARDAGIANAASAAATAQAAADSALTAAQAAQAVADGAIRTWYQSSAPTGLNNTSDIGDLWFDTDDGQAYRWNGTSWLIIEDNSIAAALAAAQNAQTTADGKITSYYQPGQPAIGEVGDLWFDTDDKNKPYYCSSISPLTWTVVRDGTIADAQATANTALTSANGKNRVFYQTSMPTGSFITGDTWFDTDDGNKIYVYNGTTFVNAQDATIATAQSTANSKVKTFVQGTTPTASTVGDIWVDTANGNILKVWSGSAWTAYQDAAIAAAQSTATTAQTSANGKNTVFYQISAPSTSGRVTGDTWFDTDDGNKIYVWNGSAWTASQLGTNAIANLAITDAQIASATISSAKIAALDAAKITTGTLAAGRIGAQTITADKVLLGDINNYIENPDFEGDTVGQQARGFQTNANTSIVDISALGGTFGTMGTAGNGTAKAVALNALSTGNNDLYGLNLIPVKVGDQFYVEYEGRHLNTAGTGNAGIGFRTFGPTKTGITWTNIAQYGVTRSTVWAKKTGTYTVPAGTAYLQVWITFSNNGETTNQFWVDNVSIRRKNEGNLIVDGAIQAGSAIIGTGAIGTAQIGDAQITTAKIANLAVTDAQIATATITSAKIANLDAAKITTGTLDANRIGADTITATHLAADSVTVNELAANSITAAKGQISDLAVVTAKIADVAITNAKIADLAVSNAKIADATIQYAKIGSVDAGTISVGTLNAARIASQSIATDKLVVASGQNLAYNGSAEATETTGYSGWIRATSTPPTGFSAYWTSTAGQSTTNFLNIPAVKIKPNTQYRVSVWVKADKTGSKTYLEPVTGSLAAGERTNPVYAFTALDVPTTWTRWTAVVTTGTAPAGTLYFRWFVNHSSGTVTDSIFSFTGFELYEMNTGELLIDGTIVAGSGIIADLAIGTAKIGDTAITTAKIADLAVTDAKIQSLDVGKVTAGWLQAGVIKAGTITASQLAISDQSTFAPSYAEDPSAWTMDGGMTNVSTSVASYDKRRFQSLVSTGASPAQRAIGPYMAVVTGDELYGEATIYRTGVTTNNMYIRYMFYDNLHTYISTGGGNLTGASQTNNEVNGTVLKIKATVPAGAMFARITLVTENATGADIGFYNVRGYRRNKGELLVDGAIVAGSAIIASAAIDGAQIKNTTITDANIQSLNAGKITAGFLDAARIDAGTLTADKIVVGLGNNLVADPNFTNATIQAARKAISDSATAGTWTVDASNQLVTLTTGGTPGQLQWRLRDSLTPTTDRMIPVTAGRKYSIQFDVFRPTGSSPLVRANIYYRNAAGAPFYVLDGMSPTNSTPPNSNAWNTVNRVWTPPSDAVAFAVDLVVSTTSGNTGLQFRNPSIRLMSDATVIEDNAIKTAHMTAGTIDAVVLAANTITGNLIVGKTISADKLVIASTDNVMPEGDFKANAVSWGGVSGAFSVDATGSRNGTQAFKIANAASQQGRYNTTEIPVESPDGGGGSSYRVSCWVKTDVALPLNGIKLYARKRNSAGTTFVTQVAAAPATAANTWIKLSGTYTVPSDSVLATFGFFSESNLSTGNTWFDNFTVTRAGDSNLIVDGAIDGKTITGALIQTSATTNAGIKFTSTAIKAYSPSSTETFSLDAATGNVTATGIFKTAISGPRIVLQDATVLGLYQASEARLFSGTASAGASLMSYETSPTQWRTVLTHRDSAGTDLTLLEMEPDSSFAIGAGLVSGGNDTSLFYLNGNVGQQTTLRTDGVISIQAAVAGTTATTYLELQRSAGTAKLSANTTMSIKAGTTLEFRGQQRAGQLGDDWMVHGGTASTNSASGTYNVTYSYPVPSGLRRIHITPYSAGPVQVAAQNVTASGFTLAFWGSINQNMSFNYTGIWAG